MSERLLERIAGFLDDGNLIYVEDSEGGWNRTGALYVFKEKWPTSIEISVGTPEYLPEMVLFWVPVLDGPDGLGSQAGEENAVDLDARELWNRVIDQIDLLNADQYFGRWTYDHDSNRVDLKHELLASDLTGRQIVETIKILERDMGAWTFLQKRLGGLPWHESNLRAFERFKASKAALESTRERKSSSTDADSVSPG